MRIFIKKRRERETFPLFDRTGAGADGRLSKGVGGEKTDSGTGSILRCCCGGCDGIRSIGFTGGDGEEGVDMFGRFIRSKLNDWGG